MDHTSAHKSVSPIVDCVLESTAIAQKAVQNTVFRPRWREKRSCGRCGYRIDLNRKTSRRIGAGEVQAELYGLGTTHASVKIQAIHEIAVSCKKYHKIGCSDLSVHAPALKPWRFVDHTNWHTALPLWFNYVLELAAIAQKAAKNH